MPATPTRRVTTSLLIHSLGLQQSFDSTHLRKLLDRAVGDDRGHGYAGEHAEVVLRPSRSAVM